MTSPSSLTDRGLTMLRIDPRSMSSHRQPMLHKLLLAAVLSIVGSLMADALLVAIGTRMFPSTRGYVHFRFHDYATLTIIGIVVACAAWPVVIRISAAPRWLFFRLATAVTLVLLLPDLYILHQGQPFKAVAILMLMHLAIGVITYNLLVHLARTHRRRTNRWSVPALSEESS